MNGGSRAGRRKSQQPPLHALPFATHWFKLGSQHKVVLHA
jgi:hypothetical protein